MQNDTKTWILSYPDVKLKSVKDKIIRDMKEINSMMKKVYSNNCVIVTITPTVNSGVIKQTTNIHIFDNFLDANPLLNQAQKEEGVNVTVMQYNLKHDKFLFILLKQYDKRNYNRIGKRRVETMFSEYGLDARIQFLYSEQETRVILHKPM